MPQLTPNFSLEELTVHPSTPSLNNMPDAAHLATLTALAQFLERIRAEALGGNGVTVNSAYRSPAVNKAVGGVPNSAHQQGNAADITCAGFGTPLAVAQAIQRWLTQNNIPFDQLIFEMSAWVHVSPKHDKLGQRRQVRTFDGTTYTDGIHPL
jgi:zinc D-Ala-D-Ala carboxypeptidase